MKEKLISTLGIIVLAVLVLTFCSAMCGGSGSSSDEPSDYDVIYIAETIVKKNLKSPSTADFCSSRECKVSKSGDVWTVTGWVDAQNGFGATIRSDYTVSFEYDGSSYTVISCNIR